MDLRFVYDGWNLVQEIDGLVEVESGVTDVAREYTWGLDLSGQSGNPSPAGIHGAGGIGGLLGTHWTLNTTSTSDDKAYIYFYDANGNVGQMIDVVSGTNYGTIAAKYEYYPFGGLLVADGVAAEANPFRFSTKYRDNETGCYYYGYRYLRTKHGRWLSRDSIGEVGGVNLYAALMNNPPSLFDPLGNSVREQNAAIAALDSEIEKHRGYLYFEDDVTGMRQFMSNLKAALRAHSPNKFILDPAVFPGALFDTGEMTIGSLSPTPNSIVHESVHLVNYQNGWHQGGAFDILFDSYLIDDEGVANAAEQMIFSLALQQLRSLEDDLRGGGLPNCPKIRRQWRTFWHFTNGAVGQPWNASKINGTVRVQDVWNLNAKYGFHLFCQQMANEYNEIIDHADPHRVKACCLVGCSQNDLGFGLHASFR